MEPLEEYLTARVRFEPSELERIRAEFTLQTVPKGTYILSNGKVCRKLWFMTSGCARTFSEMPKREITSWFYPENQFITSWYSFLHQQPSFETIEVLEDSQLLEISSEGLQQLYQQIPSFERFGRLLAEEQLAYIDYFSRGYMFLSAKERYQLLLKSFPNIELRVKLGQIASFLGISQETLSRIRSGN